MALPNPSDVYKPDTELILESLARIIELLEVGNAQLEVTNRRLTIFETMVSRSKFLQRYL